MAINYPLALPTIKTAREISLAIASQVGITRSPFTGGQQTYAWPNEKWSGSVLLPPMPRASAEEWIAFLLALNGHEGSFLCGQDGYTTPRGTWSGQSPLVNAGSQTGKTLAIDGLTAAATVKAGDLFQLGTTSTSRLYKITKDGTANGSGQITLDFTPRLRAAPADNAALTLASPKGMMLLAQNTANWSIGQAQMYGVQFAFEEDLRDV